MDDQNQGGMPQGDAGQQTPPMTPPAGDQGGMQNPTPAPEAPAEGGMETPAAPAEENGGTQPGM